MKMKKLFAVVTTTIIGISTASAQCTGGGSTCTTFQITTASGTLDIGPQNTAYAHFVHGSTITNGFYFSNRLTINSGNLNSYNGQDLSLGIGTSSGGMTTRMTIKGNGTTNGFVGIGTTAPSQRLQVDFGNMMVRGTNNFSAAGNSASLFLGDGYNYIRSLNGTGVQIGVFATDPNNNPISVNAFTVYNYGKVAVGDAANFSNLPGPYKLYVQSGILTEQVTVALYNTSSWADFVFDKNYKLRPLCEVEKFINKNKHLPEIPSAKEVVEKGVNLAEMDAKLLMKIEELTLYLVELDKKVKALEEENELLKREKSKHNP